MENTAKYYELSDNERGNLLAFLDRIDYKGLKENTALAEILAKLSSPIDLKK